MTGTVELCQAILDNKIDKVRQLIATSSDPKELVNGVCVVESCYGEDFTPLLLAAEHGYAGAQIMSILLDAGAVDAFGKDRTKGFPARKYDRYSLFNVVIDNGDVKLAVHLAKAAVVSQESAIEYVDYLLGLTAHTSWFLERPACDNWDPIGALQMATIELLALHSLVDERRDNTRPGQVNGWIAAALERQHCFILEYMMSKCGQSGWEFLWRETNWRQTVADYCLDWLYCAVAEFDRILTQRRFPLLWVWLAAGNILENTESKGTAAKQMGPLARVARQLCRSLRGIDLASSDGGGQPYITAMLQLKAAGCQLDLSNKEEREVFDKLHAVLPECAQALASVQRLHVLCANAIRRCLRQPVPIYTSELPVPLKEQRYIAGGLLDVDISMVDKMLSSK